MTSSRYTASLTMALFLILAPFVGVHAQVTPPTLKIVAPKMETKIRPGETITVIVSVSDPSVVSNIFVSGDAVGLTELQSAKSQTIFSLVVPADIRPGRYFLSAVGQTSSGQIVSAPISLMRPFDVAPTEVRVSNGPVVIPSPGTQAFLDVSLISNNDEIRVDPLTFLNFSSKNPQIVSVDADGYLTGQGAGKTQITISYLGGEPSRTIDVTVTGGMRGDVNGDGQIDSTDINEILSSLNMPANGSNDARDLNKDGKIDALDARILTTLCTYPRCSPTR